MLKKLSRLALGGLILLALLPTPAGAKNGTVPLNSGQETGRVTSGASGTFTYTIDGTELCYTLEVRNLTAAPFAAHIHPGERNEARPPSIHLTTPPAATSAVSDCITAAEGGNMTAAELTALSSDPRSHYVNVHTQRFPGGEVRGQLR